MMSIKVDTKQVIGMLNGVTRQLPFAMSLGINRAAQIVKQAATAEMLRVFKSPSKYTMNSLQLTPAHLKGRTQQKYTDRFTGELVVDKWQSTKLSAEVWFKQPEHHSTHYLEPQVFGGWRHKKAWEIAMGNHWLMPGKYAYPDNKLTRGQVTKLFNLYGKYSIGGFNQRTKDAAKRREYFALNKPRNGLQPGIYQRVAGSETGGRVGRAMIAKGLARGKKGATKALNDRTKALYPRAIQPVLLFTKAPKYQKKFDFFGVANRTLDRVFMTCIKSAVDDALKTAKAYQPRLL